MSSMDMYVLSQDVLLRRLVELRFSQYGSQRKARDRLEDGEPGVGDAPGKRSEQQMSDETRKALISKVTGSEIYWPTWLRICQGDRKVACLTLIKRQFDRHPLSIDAAVDLGPFRVSISGYQKAFRGFFGTYDIVLEQHDDFSYAYVSALKALVTEYVDFLVDLKLLDLPPGHKLDIDVYSDANSFKMKTFGIFLHFLNCKASGSMYSWLPVCILHNTDKRSTIHIMLRSHAARKWSKAAMDRHVKPLSFLNMFKCVDVHRLGESFEDISSLALKTGMVEVDMGYTGDYAALVGSCDMTVWSAAVRIPLLDEVPPPVNPCARVRASGLSVAALNHHDAVSSALPCEDGRSGPPLLPPLGSVRVVGASRPTPVSCALPALPRASPPAPAILRATPLAPTLARASPPAPVLPRALPPAPVLPRASPPLPGSQRRAPLTFSRVLRQSSPPAPVAQQRSHRAGPIFPPNAPWAYKKGLEAHYWNVKLCPFCHCPPYLLYSPCVDYDIGANARHTLLFKGARRMSVGMLHTIPTVAGGFLRDLLVVVNYWSAGRSTPVHSLLMEDYVFGKGWDPLFGVGPDAIPRRVLYKKDKKKASRKRNAAFARFRGAQSEQGEAPGHGGNGGLKFRPEFVKFQDFFGRVMSINAPWKALVYSLEQLDLARCPRFDATRDENLRLRMIEGVEHLKQWYDQVLSSTPDVFTVRVTGHSIWRLWNSMISTTFPLDHRRLHPEVIESGLHVHMKYDPRPFAIGPAAHAGLVHAHEWIQAIGPLLFPRQIEKGGEHALHRVSALTAVLPIPKFGHLERPGMHLTYALAGNFGNAFRAASVAQASVEEEAEVAREIACAVTTHRSQVHVRSDHPRGDHPSEGPSDGVGERLSWLMAGVQLASSLPVDQHKTVAQSLAVASARRRNPPGLGDSRGPHPYRKRLAKEYLIDKDASRDISIEEPELGMRQAVKRKPRISVVVKPKRSRAIVSVSSSSSSTSSSVPSEEDVDSSTTSSSSDNDSVSDESAWETSIESDN